jgi:predicted nucleic acid-binding protein
MILVVDASIVVKWYLKEVYSDIAEKLLVDGDHDLHAPELLLSEVGNVLWKKRRSGELLSDECERIARDLERRSVSYHSLRDLLLPAVIASENSQRTVYDWCYLVLAKSLNCRFITADRRFYLSIRSTAFRANVMWIEELL